MNKSDLTDYAREEYLEFGNSRTKKIAPSNSFSADLERILYTYFYLATRIVLADLLVFYQPGNKQTVSLGNRLDKSSLARAIWGIRLPHGDYIGQRASPSK